MACMNHAALYGPRDDQAVIKIYGIHHIELDHGTLRIIEKITHRLFIFAPGMWYSVESV